MKKTLGGDRLGAGKKMQVELHGYERSTHDLGYVWRSTMAAGTLVPFIKELALPGDTFDIDLGVDVKTHPTIGPLFGSYKVQLDIFQCPIRLYNGQLHNNKLGIGLKMNTVKLPLIDMRTHNLELYLADTFKELDIDNFQINSSSIFSYLGIRGVGIYNNPGGDATRLRQFNAVPWLAYWDIYKNYYANKQEEVGAVIHTGVDPVDQNVGTITHNTNGIPQTTPATPEPVNTGDQVEINLAAATPQNPDEIILLITGPAGPEWVIFSSVLTYLFTAGGIQYYEYQGVRGPIMTVLAWDYVDTQAARTMSITKFDLVRLDDMREYILSQTTNPLPVVLSTLSPEPFNLALQEHPTNPLLDSKTCTQEGLGIKTYQSDLFNNWLSTEWIDGANGISEITAVDTSSGSFTMDTLALSKKVYDMLNRIAVSGGTYDDWLDAVYTHDRYVRAESPIYQGGLIKELVFQEVVSNAAAEGTSPQPLGTIAGKGILAQKHKGGQVTIRVDEPSYIIGIVSLTPRIDYSQGNDWDVHLRTMDDLHKPALDEIGFQELITEQMAWWDTYYDTPSSSWKQRSAGKQPAWINYMTNINRVRGNFAVEGNEMFMTLNRLYEPNVTVPGIGGVAVQIKDLTTYIDPRKYNQIFAETSLDAQNFWTQIGVDMKVRRKISARVMPNL